MFTYTIHEPVSWARSRQISSRSPALPRWYGEPLMFEDHPRAFSRVGVERRTGRPRVFAHRDPELRAGHPYRAGRFPRDERALLVEDAVVRQLHLVVARDDLAVADQPGRVVDAGGGSVDEAGEDRASPGRLPRQAFHRLEVVVDERRPQDQVLGWVAGDRELGEHHDVGVRFGRSRRPGDEAFDVALEVAHRRVDLAERDAHHRTSAYRRPACARVTRRRRCRGCRPPTPDRHRAGGVERRGRATAGARCEPRRAPTSDRSASSRASS